MVWWIVGIVVFVLFLIYIWCRSERITSIPSSTFKAPAVDLRQETKPDVEAVWPQSATFTGPAVDLPPQDSAPQPPPPPPGEDHWTPDAIVDGRLMRLRKDGQLPPPIRR